MTGIGDTDRCSRCGTLYQRATPSEVATRNAQMLVYYANELRTSGSDVGLVILDEHGVGQAPVNLADALWLLALDLDADTAMGVSS